MLIKPDELDSVAIDKFVGTSGKYKFALCKRFEPLGDGMIGYYIVAIVGNRVAKVVRIAVDNPLQASLRWERWKELLTMPAEGEEPSLLEDLMTSITQSKEDIELKTKPRGARIFVRPITAVDEVTARAEAAGLVAVVDNRNKPRSTTGIVMAIGEDPLTQELYKVGDIVVYSPHAGVIMMEEGTEYRALELHEIIGVREAENEDWCYKCGAPAHCKHCRRCDVHNSAEVHQTQPSSSSSSGT